MGNAFCLAEDGAEQGMGAECDAEQHDYPLTREEVLGYARTQWLARSIEDGEHADVHPERHAFSAETLRTRRAEAVERHEAVRQFEAMNFSKSGVLTWPEIRAIFVQSRHESEDHARSWWLDLVRDCGVADLQDAQAAEGVVITASMYTDWWMGSVGGVQIAKLLQQVQQHMLHWPPICVDDMVECMRASCCARCTDHDEEWRLLIISSCIDDPSALCTAALPNGEPVVATDCFTSAARTEFLI
eukprot:SAG11_NODE_4494_length_1875_cov_1.214527_2_plen_244_part_00